MEPLIVSQDRLIGYLEKNGYSESYIVGIRREIRVILGMRESKSWVSYESLYENYCSCGYSSGYLAQKRTALNMVARFETQDVYPGTLPRTCELVGNCFQKDSFKNLSPEFQDVILNYVSMLEGRGLRASTMVTAFRNVLTFLRHMQDSGATRLAEIRERHVLDFFLSAGGHKKRGYTCKYHVGKALDSYARKCPGSRDVAIILPDARKARKNVQYLTREEISRIKLALGDHGNALDFRDRAVGALLLYTGLRRSDIAGLRLEDIRWKEDAIILHQQKTGIVLALPLRPIVGNAIYDYVNNERPRVVGGNLFLSKRGPHKGIGAEVVSNKILARIFNAAGVRMNKGDRRGSHLFRYNLAISLLGNDVSQAVISATLGHESPQSTETYLNADFRHLRDCAIDMSNYPMSEEVFNV